ncbi:MULTISPECIES: type II toxin-antitoxin system PemK/MazF family toxin [Microcystis]|uniref:type II toxin-antitoxin system PemK/MazF family toxin n=1 Tax=Microcystis TaxID=1125 RepID=UPI00278C339A|nr:type II toxin-antitoxin system PemK/MazF family toxin [Microcystis aeruginosa]
MYIEKNKSSWESSPKSPLESGGKLGYWLGKDIPTSQHPNFSQTGLKKTSVIRTDKIATVNQSVFQQKLGILPSDILNQVQTALKKSLNIP